MDIPMRGFIRASAKRRHLKKRIIQVLETEKVAYEMEIARRIDVRIHRTIKKVLATMFYEGELDRSDVENVHKNIKVRFYWKVKTDPKTIEKIMERKKRLLKTHMKISTVQKRFGPKLAIASLKALAQSGYVPLNLESIRGPITKWSGPDDAWSEDPIVKSHGDIDVVALQNDGKRLWLGEVKMRGDLLKQVQVEHFYASAIDFKLQIFHYKGIDYRLKLFVLAPVSSVSAKEYCLRKKIELIECAKAYYPNETPKRGSVTDFYERYRWVMGFPNLKLVSLDSLPVKELTDVMRVLGSAPLADTI